jgi:hypothetical protein
MVTTNADVIQSAQRFQEAMVANPPTVLSGVIIRDLLYRELKKELSNEKIVVTKENGQKLRDRIRHFMDKHIDKDIKDRDNKIREEIEDFISYVQSLNKNEKEYRENLALVKSKFVDTDRFTVLEPKSAFNMFVQLKEMEGFDQFDFAKKLFLEKGVEIHPGPGFGLTRDKWEGKNGLGFWIRISFAIDREELERGLKGLVEFIEECKINPSKVKLAGANLPA